MSYYAFHDDDMSVTLANEQEIINEMNYALENIENLVKKYKFDPSLLNLELTESAYVDNPISTNETITHLQNYGFTIMMDDFESGYSSLSILKDIPVDVLKIYMRFLSKTKISRRCENIIASILRMAKWINITTIVEGVETAEQIEFLRSKRLLFTNLWMKVLN